MQRNFRTGARILQALKLSLFCLSFAIFNRMSLAATPLVSDLSLVNKKNKSLPRVFPSPENLPLENRKNLQDSTPRAQGRIESLSVSPDSTVNPSKNQTNTNQEVEVFKNKDTSLLADSDHTRTVDDPISEYKLQQKTAQLSTAKSTTESPNKKLNAGKIGKNSVKEKPIMDKIYINFLDLLKLSASTKSFTAADNKKRISESISSLESLAKELSQHPKSTDFDFIVGNFQRDTRELSSTWKAGRYRESQFIIRTLTDNCISCHTSQESIYDSSLADKKLENKRLENKKAESKKSPLQSDFSTSSKEKPMPNEDLQQSLSNEIDDKNLNLIERAQLKTALREFSESLNLYEKALSPNNISVYPSLMLEGYLTDYIIVALRVKQDTGRVISTLEKIYLDPSLPYSLSMTIKKWLSTLKDFKEVKLNSLDDIEKYVSDGYLKSSFPLDSGGIVTNILAVNRIRKLLEEANLSPIDQARSYLISGVCELSINRPLQISRANYYLEKAILVAPKTEIAKKAYYYLESNIFYENSGSLGVFVPQEELDKLKSLKKLIE